ncbi:unnamed protein product [Musa acuminata var. zebrina]
MTSSAPPPSMAAHAGEADANMQILQELERLSRSLSKSHTSRRTTSLVLPRSSYTAPAADDGPRLVNEAARSDRRNHSSRHLSRFPWHLGWNPQHDLDGDDADGGRHRTPVKREHTLEPEPGEKRGIWSWKPMRALAHIAMHRLVCLFSVEVIAIQHLPTSMDGLRLSVAVRKKETKDGAVQTMPSRVLEGCADFEETLFVRCHLYCRGGAAAGKPLEFEARPFLISTVAVDVPQIDLGRSIVDLSLLVKESIQKNLEGQRIRQWDLAFPLSGKAKGGEMVLKLAFQIMEDGGIGIYNQAEKIRSNKEKDSNSSVPRKQSKSSFSVALRGGQSTIPSNTSSVRKVEETKDFGLDHGPGLRPSIPPVVQKAKPYPREEDPNLPDFEVIDKGIEIQEEKVELEEVIPEDATEVSSVSSEVVKEVVHDRAQWSRLKELHVIAKEIKALELIMIDGGADLVKTTQEDKFQRLDTEEEIVTREFVRMLEFEDGKEPKYDGLDLVTSSDHGAKEVVKDEEEKILVPDLGKSLGSVVQTRDGGYLVSMNPFNVQVTRKETPKLAMQISREVIVEDEKQASELQLFQRLAAMGSEEMVSRLLSQTAMDELLGKTAEQIAFEGVASAIISGRNKEGASSSAARSITIVRKMAAATNKGRKERTLTGTWSVNDEPVAADEILALSLQRMEAMAVEALKVQADMADEEAEVAPSEEVSPVIGNDDAGNPLDSAISLEDWLITCSTSRHMTMLVVIQLRDPLRRNEAVGAPMIAVVQAAASDDDQPDDERRFKLISLHVGGVKLSSNRKRSTWDGEKQRLTAMQWLVENGLGKAGRRAKQMQAKRGHDLIWSITSRITSGAWLKPVRNPNVIFLSDSI